MLRPVALAISLALLSLPIHATTYTFEPNHTQGMLSWNHLGFSNPGALFSLVEGSVSYDPADPTQASVSVTIPVAKLSSGVPELDDELHDKTFFDVARFPLATFKSTRVEKGRMAGQLKVTGDFSLHGVTRPVTLDVTLNKLGENPRRHLTSIGFEATTTLLRSDYGLGRFVPQVSDAIQVHITCQADEAKAYAQQLRADEAEAALDAQQAVKTVPADPRSATNPPAH